MGAWHGGPPNQHTHGIQMSTKCEATKKTHNKLAGQHSAREVAVEVLRSSNATKINISLL